MMGILIGMDEAGYGPNLGPLVVAATAWEVAEEVRGRRSEVREGEPASAGGSSVSLASAARPSLGQVDLYRQLRGAVCRSPSERQIAIADSKTLYRPGLGLRQLERGVHAALAAIGRSASCWSNVVECWEADPDGRHRQLCWHDGFNCRLPIDATTDELARLGERLSKACDNASVRPIAIRARLVFPAEFNDLVEYHGTKGAALSHVTIGLLREVMDSLRAGVDPSAAADSPVFVVCDKHGGRNRYHSLLQHFFPDPWIDTLVESRAESRYHWAAADAGVEIAFRAGGEAFLPAALASMTAKYLRELAMRAFNEFWCARVPGLRPTAGYPTDAPRFKAAIASVQRELGIDDHVLWRNR
jgi:hypothetical protein